MPLCRCEFHPPNNKLANKPYIVTVKPKGFPNTSSICGRPGCEELGMIWLTKDEHTEFLNGEDIFAYNRSNETKVWVENPNTRKKADLK